MKKWTVPCIELHTCNGLWWLTFALGWSGNLVFCRKVICYLFSSWVLLANTNKNQTKKVAWDQAPQWGRGKKRGEGGGKDGKPGHAFDSLPFHRYALIGQMSQCWQIRGAVDGWNIMLFWSCWQIHSAVDIWNISCSFDLGKHCVFKHRFRASNINFNTTVWREHQS